MDDICIDIDSMACKSDFRQDRRINRYSLVVYHSHSFSKCILKFPHPHQRRRPKRNTLPSLNQPTLTNNLAVGLISLGTSSAPTSVPAPAPSLDESISIPKLSSSTATFCSERRCSPKTSSATSTRETASRSASSSRQPRMRIPPNRARGEG